MIGGRPIVSLRLGFGGGRKRKGKINICGVSGVSE